MNPGPLLSAARQSSPGMIIPTSDNLPQVVFFLANLYLCSVKIPDNSPQNNAYSSNNNPPNRSVIFMWGRYQSENSI